MRKRTLCLILALVLAVSLLTISASGAEKRPWEDPYRQLIKDTVDKGGWSIDLADLDYDGTPELLMARYPGSGLFQIVSDGYTFRNGAAQKLHTKGEYEDFFRFSTGTYEGEKLSGFMTYYNPATGAMKTEGYYLVRSGAAEHGMVFATAALNGTELSQQVLFAESTLTQTDTTTYYIGDQKVTHAAYTAAFQTRNNGWTNVTQNGGNPTMDSGMGKTPKDAEIDALFAAWTGGFHTVGSFKDVLSTDYFAEAVQWAASHNPVITDGTSDTTFSPNDPCTRGQVVTFLWRAMGCPEPKSTNNPFKDVNVSDYYGKAVLWAVENQITDGMSEGVFAPDATVTRSQVVTFLWRAEEQPTVAEANRFNDVPQNEYYFNAALWAIANEITDGTTTTTFSPNDPCTRGQIVTFLYRDMAE